MKKLINSLFATKVDAIGLSIFRMFYSVVLFLNYDNYILTGASYTIKSHQNM
jgi:hypothetical protein